MSLSTFTQSLIETVDLARPILTWSPSYFLFLDSINATKVADFKCDPTFVCQKDCLLPVLDLNTRLPPYNYTEDADNEVESAAEGVKLVVTMVVGVILLGDVIWSRCVQIL